MNEQPPKKPAPPPPPGSRREVRTVAMGPSDPMPQFNLIKTELDPSKEEVQAQIEATSFAAAAPSAQPHQGRKRRHGEVDSEDTEIARLGTPPAGSAPMAPRLTWGGDARPPPVNAQQHMANHLRLISPAVPAPSPQLQTWFDPTPPEGLFEPHPEPTGHNYRAGVEAYHRQQAENARQERIEANRTSTLRPIVHPQTHNSQNTTRNIEKQPDEQSKHTKPPQAQPTSPKLWYNESLKKKLRDSERDLSASTNPDLQRWQQAYTSSHIAQPSLGGLYQASASSYQSPHQSLPEQSFQRTADWTQFQREQAQQERDQQQERECRLLEQQVRKRQLQEQSFLPPSEPASRHHTNDLDFHKQPQPRQHSDGYPPHHQYDASFSLPSGVPDVRQPSTNLPYLPQNYFSQPPPPVPAPLTARQLARQNSGPPRYRYDPPSLRPNLNLPSFTSPLPPSQSHHTPYPQTPEPHNKMAEIEGNIVSIQKQIEKLQIFLEAEEWEIQEQKGKIEMMERSLEREKEKLKGLEREREETRGRLEQELVDEQRWWMEYEAFRAMGIEPTPVLKGMLGLAGRDTAMHGQMGVSTQNGAQGQSSQRRVWNGGTGDTGQQSQAQMGQMGGVPLPPLAPRPPGLPGPPVSRPLWSGGHSQPQTQPSQSQSQMGEPAYVPQASSTGRQIWSGAPPSQQAQQPQIQGERRVFVDSITHSQQQAAMVADQQRRMQDQQRAERQRELERQRQGQLQQQQREGQQDQNAREAQQQRQRQQIQENAREMQQTQQRTRQSEQPRPSSVQQQRPPTLTVPPTTNPAGSGGQISPREALQSGLYTGLRVGGQDIGTAAHLIQSSRPTQPARPAHSARPAHPAPSAPQAHGARPPQPARPALQARNARRPLPDRPRHNFAESDDDADQESREAQEAESWDANGRGTHTSAPDNGNGNGSGSGFDKEPCVMD